MTAASAETAASREAAAKAVATEARVTTETATPEARVSAKTTAGREAPGDAAAEARHNGSHGHHARECRPHTRRSALRCNALRWHSTRHADAGVRPTGLHGRARIGDHP